MTRITHTVQYITLVCLLCLATGGCVSVKEYQKNRINDSEMDLAGEKPKSLNKVFICTEKAPLVRMVEKAAADADVTESIHSTLK
jgi:hypothetical protein